MGLVSQHKTEGSHFCIHTIFADFMEVDFKIAGESLAQGHLKIICLATAKMLADPPRFTIPRLVQSNKFIFHHFPRFQQSSPTPLVVIWTNLAFGVFEHAAP